jgi:O-succinylhomoserine sulfhydrylase
MSEDWSTRTKLVHAGIRRSQYGEMAEAIFLTQGFVYDSAEAAEARFLKAGEDEFIYARYGNPTVRMFEERIAALEGTEDAFATASGMAAVNGALVSMLRAGDHVVSSRALFGSCLYILEEVLTRYGVEVTFVDGTDLDQWRAAVRPGTKAVFFESMSNPTLEVIDIGRWRDRPCGGRHGDRRQRLRHADLLARREPGRGCGGLFHDQAHRRAGPGAGRRDLRDARVHPQDGGALHEAHRRGDEPLHAWIMLKGMETLDLRCRAQAAGALEIARALEGDARLARVIYPGLPSHPQHAIAMAQIGSGGTVIALDLKGGKEAAFRFLNALASSRSRTTSATPSRS